MSSKKLQQKQDENIFRNDTRVNALIECAQRCDRERMMELIEDRSVNGKVYKKLKGKSVTWEDLKDEVVWHSIPMHNTTRLSRGTIALQHVACGTLLVVCSIHMDLGRS